MLFTVCLRNWRAHTDDRGVTVVEYGSVQGLESELAGIATGLASVGLTPVTKSIGDEVGPLAVVAPQGDVPVDASRALVGVLVATGQAGVGEVRHVVEAHATRVAWVACGSLDVARPVGSKWVAPPRH